MPPPQNPGWAAGTNAQQRPLDLSLPKHISSEADVRASLPNPVRAQLEAALSSYTAKIETTLGHDAMSMARGRKPVREGDTLSAAQQTELQNASTDFLKKLGGQCDAHFKNFKATGTVTGHVDLGNSGRLMQYDLNRPNLNLSAYATANRQGMETIGGNVVYRPNDNLTLSAGVNHNFQTDHTTANAEAAWKVNKDVDFALSASHDSRGDSRIGAGVRIRF